jgi:hypothetical protein
MKRKALCDLFAAVLFFVLLYFVLLLGYGLGY